MPLNLILLRGLPGCGKTTLASLWSAMPGAVVVSLDDYFTDAAGNYHFRFQDNHIAYQLCIDRVAEAMIHASPTIVVHNTFVYDWEMKPYLDLAKKHTYRLHVCTVEKHHTGTNVHEVSQEQIEKMAEKFQVRLK